MRSLVALLELSLLIGIHELGHVLAARLFGVRLARFTFGMGPALFRWKPGHAEWMIRLVPLGAGVRLEGENPHEGQRAGLSALSAWKQLVVVSAGPLASYLLALVVLMTLYRSGTHVPVPRTLGTVEPGGEAARALLRPGDQIVAIDGAPVASWSEFTEHVAQSPGIPLALTVIRQGEPVMVRAIPQRAPDGTGRLGVTQQYVYREHRFTEAVTGAFLHTGLIVIEGAQLLVHQARGRPMPELGSPLTAVRASGDAATSSPDGFWRVFAALSVALALFYLVPLPGLDGGKMLLLAFEATTGRTLPARWQTAIHAIGFLALMAGLLWLAGGELYRAVRVAREGARAAQLRESDAGVPDLGDGGLRSSAGTGRRDRRGAGAPGWVSREAWLPAGQPAGERRPVTLFRFVEPGGQRARRAHFEGSHALLVVVPGVLLPLVQPVITGHSFGGGVDLAHWRAELMATLTVDPGPIERASRGDRDAFAQLVRAHHRWVSGIALAELRDPSASDDVAQEVFLAAWRGLPRLRNPASFAPWLRQLTRNQARLHRRRGRLAPIATGADVLEQAADSAAPLDDTLARAEQEAALWEAYEALPSELREVLALFYREGESSRQVAALLGLSDAAVRKRLSRGRERLREALGETRAGLLGRLLGRGQDADTVVSAVMLALPSSLAAGGAGAGALAGWAKGSAWLSGMGALGGGIGGGLLGTYLRMRWELQRANSVEDLRRLKRFGRVMVATTLGGGLLMGVLVQLPARQWTLPIAGTLLLAWVAYLKFGWLEQSTAERNARERAADPTAAARQRRGLRQRMVVFTVSGLGAVALLWYAALRGLLG